MSKVYFDLHSAIRIIAGLISKPLGISPVLSGAFRTHMVQGTTYEQIMARLGLMASSHFYLY